MSGNQDDRRAGGGEPKPRQAIGRRRSDSVNQIMEQSWQLVSGGQKAEKVMSARGV